MSKTVIISDTHLTGKFQPDKFRQLQNIFERSDQVIINGDFWDAYMLSARDFVFSEWRKLFPTLKDRTAIYLVGNHDRRAWSELVAEQFADKFEERFSLQVGDLELVVEHGHRIIPGHNDKWFGGIIPRHPLFGAVAWYREEIGTKVSGEAFFQRFAKYNRRMKEWTQHRLLPHQVLVTGHTHLAEFSPDAQYINVGCVKGGYGHYLEIEGDQLALRSFRYEK